MHIVAIGEILWDIFGAEEHLGGAPFNFAAHAARLGCRVEMLSAVGTDDRGRRALVAAESLGVSTRLVRTVESPATGSVTVTVDDLGQPDYVIHRPAAYDTVALSDRDVAALATDPPDWVYFGTLLQMAPSARAVTLKFLEAAPGANRLYDINLRKNSYSRELLAKLLPLATVLKVNVDEAAELQRLFGEPETDVQTFAREYATRFGYTGVCVTLGADGCFVLWNGEETSARGYSTVVADAVGAGDAFAAAFLHGVSSGWPIEETADFANRVGALVASRAGAVPEWAVDEAWAL